MVQHPSVRAKLPKFERDGHERALPIRSRGQFGTESMERARMAGANDKGFRIKAFEILHALLNLASMDDRNEVSKHQVKREYGQTGKERQDSERSVGGRFHRLGFTVFKLKFGVNRKMVGDWGR
jgi:hypothetical protein